MQIRPYVNFVYLHYRAPTLDSKDEDLFCFKKIGTAMILREFFKDIAISISQREPAPPTSYCFIYFID